MRFTRVTLFFIAFIITFGFYQLARNFLAEVEPQTFQATEEMMVDTANLLAEVVTADMRADGFETGNLRKAFDGAHARRFEAKIFDHLKQKVGIQAYLTDTNGIVLFDSDGGRREGMNYSSKLDVRARCPDNTGRVAVGKIRRIPRLRSCMSQLPSVTRNIPLVCLQFANPNST